MTAPTWQVRRRAISTWLLRCACGLALLAVAMSAREWLVVIPAFLLALIAFRGWPCAGFSGSLNARLETAPLLDEWKRHDRRRGHS
jgi:hypothetical protein